MSNRPDLIRLAPESLSEGLERAGLSLAEFCRLFDLNYDNARRWLVPEGHKRSLEPPYWVTPVLASLVNHQVGPGVLAIAQRCRAESLAQEAEPAL